MSSSPRQARRARIDAIIADTPLATDEPYDQTIASWMIEDHKKSRQQKASARRPPQPSSNSSLRTSNKTSTSQVSMSSSSNSVGQPGRGGNNGPANKNREGSVSWLPPPTAQDNDFIMVDLLDGEHLPTNASRIARSTQMLSHNSDSIISLPPIAMHRTCNNDIRRDHHAAHSAVPDSLHSLRLAEARAMRRTRHRVTSSVGTPGGFGKYSSISPSPSQSSLPPSVSASTAASQSGSSNLKLALNNNSSLPTDSSDLPMYFPNAHPPPPQPPPRSSTPVQNNPTVPQQEPFNFAQHTANSTGPSNSGRSGPPLASRSAQQKIQSLPAESSSSSSTFTPSSSQPFQQIQSTNQRQQYQDQNQTSRQQHHSRSRDLDSFNNNMDSITLRQQQQQQLDTRIPIQPLRPVDSTTPLRGSTAAHDAHFRIGSYCWFDEETNSYAPSTSSSQARRKGRNREHRHRFTKGRHDFRPNEWGWRRPAEEDAIMPNEAWGYLLLIGAITFVTASIINSSSDFLSKQIIHRLANLIGSLYGGDTGKDITLALLRGISLAISFFIALRLSPHYGAGSGIPEMKCVLGGVLMPHMLNWRTLVGKTIGLVFSLASSISIGRLGPFIHMSCISAALVSRLTIFPSLRANTRFQMQALSAAMAAGVGATFGAPLGGTMLAVEIMSTYYYIHWIPMALYCSIMGYYFLLAVTQDTPSYFTTGSIDLQKGSLHNLFSFVLLGALCGGIGAALVHFSKAMFQLRRQFFKNAVPWRTACMLIIFAAFHSIFTSHIGGVLSLPQREGVDDLFMNKNADGNTWLPGALELSNIERLNSALALLVVMVVKFVLTGMSIVMPVPAGVFMPIFQIGALFGRAFGEGWGAIPAFAWLDPQGAAIIGAAAMTAGSLHTVSVAVVMLELTREAIDVLPLAIGVIVSYGVSKRLCSDLFSELIRIRKLPYILGLRERYPWETKQFYDDVAREEAASLMKTDFPFVTPMSTRREIWDMLNKGGKPWITCALLSDSESRCLWGTVSQQTLWDIIMEDIRVTQGNDSSSSNIDISNVTSNNGNENRRRRRQRIDEPEYGTFNASESGTLRGLETIPFLREFDPTVGHPLVDMGPMQTSVHTPFWKIVTLFRMLSMAQMYVMHNGKTVGCISKADVIMHSIFLEQKSQRRRRRDEAAMLRQQRMSNGSSSRHPGATGALDLTAAFKQTRRSSAGLPHSSLPKTGSSARLATSGKARPPGGRNDGGGSAAGRSSGSGSSGGNK